MTSGWVPLAALAWTASATQECPSGETAWVRVNDAETGLCVDLTNGRLLVGEVCVRNDDDTDTLQVAVAADEGWALTGFSLWLGDDSQSYPMTRQGRPNVADFPYQHAWCAKAAKQQHTVDSISYSSLGDLGLYDDWCAYCGVPTGVPPFYMMATVDVFNLDPQLTGETAEEVSAWAEGDPVVDRGCRATQTQVLVEAMCSQAASLPPAVTSLGPLNAGAALKCTRAWAYDAGKALCLLDMDEDGDGEPDDFVVAGFTNGEYLLRELPEEGTPLMLVVTDNCAVSGSVQVGQVWLRASERGRGYAQVDVATSDGFVMQKTLLHVGATPLPTTTDGALSAAPQHFAHSHQRRDMPRDRFNVRVAKDAAADDDDDDDDDDGVHLVLAATVCGEFPLRR